MMNFTSRTGKRRVVITGAGAITPVGNSVEEFWESLLEGRSGTGEITTFDYTKTNVSLAAEVKDFNPKDHFDHKEIRRTDKATRLGIVAARQAFENSGLDFTEYDPYMMGIMYGSGIGGYNAIEEEILNYAASDRNPRNISPFFIPKYISNMTPGKIAMEYPIFGDNMTVTTACASSTHAIGEAFHKIANGYLDMALAGGSESTVTETAVVAFDNMTALSRNQDPETASRPFDQDRDGFLMGEGAVLLVLETLEGAVKRGANILAEITGYGATTDGYHITSPDPTGKGDSAAIKKAIKDAGLTADDIDYFNAHGTSTPLNEKYEVIALKKALGERASQIPITSIKGNTGHLLGAAGAAEALASALILQTGIIPKTRGTQNLDPEFDVDVVFGENRETDAKIALSNNLGFGGQNGVLVIEKYEGK